MQILWNSIHENRLCEKSDCIPCNSHTSADDDTNASATNKFMVIG